MKHRKRHAVTVTLDPVSKCMLDELTRRFSPAGAKRSTVARGCLSVGLKEVYRKFCRGKK